MLHLLLISCIGIMIVYVVPFIMFLATEFVMWLFDKIKEFVEAVKG